MRWKWVFFFEVMRLGVSLMRKVEEIGSRVLRVGGVGVVGLG